MTKMLECGLYTQQSSKRKLKIYATAKSKRNYKTRAYAAAKQIAGLYRNGSGTTSTGIAATAPEFSGVGASSFRPGLLKPRFT